MEDGLRWIIYTLSISYQRGWKPETKSKCKGYQICSENEDDGT